ncbi:MAG: hypothetical protein M3480_10445 [Verrucomicrobiota bacterium]|nr:hypothetical protein [Chthoniobacterales bacterium]MDQ3415366.1 hypothetical protein [Verrucomicrobiota bacterium]
MPARAIFLVAVLLPCVPLLARANGGVFETSAIERSGNLVPMLKRLITLEKETLKVDLDGDRAGVYVTYLFKNEEETPLGARLAQGIHPAQPHPDNLETMLGQHHAPVFQPFTAGRAIGLGVLAEIRPAPVISVPRATVNRSLDLRMKSSAAGAKCLSSTRSPVKQTNSGASWLIRHTTSAAYSASPL